MGQNGQEKGGNGPKWANRGQNGPKWAKPKKTLNIEKKTPKNRQKGQKWAKWAKMEQNGQACVCVARCRQSVMERFRHTQLSYYI